MSHRYGVLLALSLSACTPVPLVTRDFGTSMQQRAERLLPIVKEAARRHGVAPELVLAVIRIESSFNPRARSSAGTAYLAVHRQNYVHQ